MKYKYIDHMKSMCKYVSIICQISFIWSFVCPFFKKKYYCCNAVFDIPIVAHLFVQCTIGK